MGASLSPARALLRQRRVWFCLLALGLFAGAAGSAVYLYRADREEARRRQLAEQALERQDLPEAIGQLQSYLALVPRSADGRFLLARTLRRAGKYDEAESELAEASRLGSDPEVVRRETALARLQRRGVRERTGAELTALAQAPGADKALWEALYRGDVAARNWDRAGFWLYLWLERWPDDWAPRLWQADLLERFKNYDRARADYLRVLELRPDDPRALLKVGLIALANRGDYDEAETYLTRCLARDPGNAEAAVGLARCAYARGNLPAARDGARAVLAGNPRHAVAALLLGMIEAEAGHDDEALAPLRVAEAEGADRLRVYFQLAQVLWRLGRADEADQYTRRYSELREAYRAREAAIRAAEQEPHNPDRQFEIGRLSMLVGEEDEAAKQFLIALKENPRHRPSHAALADYFSRQSDPDAAVLVEYHRRQAQLDAPPTPKRPGP